MDPAPTRCQEKNGSHLSGPFKAVGLVRVPMSHGLWAVTAPVDVKLIQGVQNVRVAVIAGQRGVALRSFELKAKSP